MKEAKLTPDLSARLTNAAAEDVLDVVVELRAEGAPAQMSQRSRQEEISSRKQAFGEEAVPVEETIQRAGGEVVERAWINQTVLARVPARGVDELSELDGVAALDVPRTLEADRG